ncbi:MAG: mechanosensitive ion channel family protein [Clostridia bacterium]|nr:mechanosensitive ion channel family protein [Clostridia bacterium]
MEEENLTWLQKLSNAITERFGDGIGSIAMKIVAALIILIVGLLIVKLIIKLIRKSKWYTNLASEVQTFAVSGVKVLGYLLVILLAVATVGVPIASIIAVLASCGLAVGMALQGSLANLAGGIMLLVFRPFHVGDFISDGTHDGTVREITLFYTTIDTLDNLRVTLPNGPLANSAIKNLNRNDIRRLDIDVTLAPASDREKVQALMLECAKAHELVFEDPAPETFVTVTDGGLPTYKLRTWFKSGDYWTVYFDLNKAVQAALKENDIPLAHQQVDIHTDK